jgi:TrmH family RNA methyltransferase
MDAMSVQLSSVHNPRVKALIRLEKRSERDQRAVALVEGRRELQRALAARVIPSEAYICPELVRQADGQQIVEKLKDLAKEHGLQLFTVTPEVFAKIAYREDSDGLLAIVPFQPKSIDLLTHRTSSRPSFYAVIEGAEKPGNLGAILRTADAAGVEALILTDSATDIRNPNLVRASLGACFTVPIIESSLPETLAALRRQQVQIVAADPQATKSYYEIDYQAPTAIVMGSEAHGLSAAMRNAADHLAAIPMHGVVDSLNLATATALLLYEVVRQRSQTQRHELF